MPSSIEYARPSTSRRRPWRQILLVGFVVLLTPVLAFVGFVGWFEYEMTRNEVIIMVDNRSTHAVDAMLFDKGAPTSVLALAAVKGGTRADDSKNAWHVISPAVFNVRVGSQDYEGEAGTLLDDDGPHRFWITAFDDHVVVTRQSNEDPWDLKMVAVTSTTRP